MRPLMVLHYKQNRVPLLLLYRLSPPFLSQLIVEAVGSGKFSCFEMNWPLLINAAVEGVVVTCQSIYIYIYIYIA